MAARGVSGDAGEFQPRWAECSSQHVQSRSVELGTVEVGIGKQSNWIGSELELPLIPPRHPFILVFNLLAVAVLVQLH